MRFSKDKTPYKDHIDFIFWDGDRKRATSSFLLRIRERTVEVAVGTPGFEKAALARFRERVADERSGPALEKTVARLEKAGFELGAPHYKKLPRGFEPISEARDRLLRHASLFASRVEPHPEAFATKAFAGWCVRHWKKTLPLRAWLLEG